MGSVNRALIVGALGQDAEVRSFSSGKPVMNFSVATSETWKDKSGERQERTEWHKVTCVNERTIDAISGYLKKGTQVYVEGRIQTRKWTDKNGQDRYSTEIMVGPGDSITLLGRPPGERDDGKTNGGPQRGSGGGRQRYDQRREQMDDLSQEVPF